MRNLLSLAAVAVIAVAGCNRSPQGGDTQRTDANSTFRISAPAMATSIKQGDKETANLSISRGSDFKRDVQLAVKAPNGITARLNKDRITASEGTEFNVTLDVAKDAPLGDHKVTVTGTPDGGGAPTSVDFTVKVTAP
jgi:uncharacterized membrane protein